MGVDIGAPYLTRVKQALRDDQLRTALDRATERLSGHRAEAMAAVDGVRLRQEARAARESAIRNLPRLLEQLERNLIANGCHVHWARDATEAIQAVVEIGRQHAVRHIVKSKSMVTEEIRLNDGLERSGFSVVETDLGEYIIQLAGEPPSHITAPVIHKRAEDIAELFQRKLGMAATDDVSEMCSAARGALRSEFLRADMGISGCNFAIAETGTVCLITNEGNGRMVTSLPRVYVAVAGIEKVVPRVEHATLLWQAATRSATGQEASVYFTMNSGPRRPDHGDGPEEMHVVLLDNGRTRVLERGYGEALLCIRCGACLNVCPVYREIGGHAYASTYGGPIGAVLTPLLQDDIAASRELPYASTLCGACREVCPVRIDLPRLLLDLRSDLVTKRTLPVLERTAHRAYARAAESPDRYTRWMRIVQWMSRILTRKQHSIRMLPPPLGGWTRTRDFPPFPARSFRERWNERMQRIKGSEGGTKE